MYYTIAVVVCIKDQVVEDRLYVCDEETLPKVTVTAKCLLLEHCYNYIPNFSKRISKLGDLSVDQVVEEGGMSEGNVHVMMQQEDHDSMIASIQGEDVYVSPNIKESSNG
jgi:hypothetical protein